jgi:phosphoglycolate phosphatase
MDNDAIIFDIDGTLWNASTASSNGWNAALAKIGIDKNISPKQIEKVAGNPYEKCVDILLPGLKVKYPDLIRELNDSEMEAVKSSGGNFYDGVIEGFRKLAGKYKIFLVSNCQDWYLNVFLDFSGLKPVLTGFDCHGMSGLPKSEMLSRIQTLHSLSNPVYIGDTASDEKAAKEANIEFIYASWGFGAPAGETKTVNSFNELVYYLEK